MTKSITIIGGGIAGLAAGCYARMNGYAARIYEMHSMPGGLCSSWRRQGYLVDGCIEWLCGSGPGVSLHEIWEELGTMEDLSYYHQRALVDLELPGLNFRVYTDADEWEAYLLTMAPEDADFIHELTQAIRDFRRYADAASAEMNTPEGEQYMAKWMSVTLGELVARIKNPQLSRAMSTLWGEPTPAFYGLLSLGYSQARSAGYPIGGSLSFARAIEQRFCALGGEIHYNAPVKKILVEDDRAVGLQLADGTRVWEREGDILSTADAHLTMFDLLEEKYLDETIRVWFEQVPVIEAPVLVTLGVELPMQDAPISTSGLLFQPVEPVVMYGQAMKLLCVRVMTYDPTSAPQGKAVARVSLPGNYAFWKQLSETPEAYQAEKERIAGQVIAALDGRFPGLAAKVEMVDVATTTSFERYTGNWHGSSQGWLPTPQASALVQAAAQSGHWPVSKTLPGLSHFYMAGQWTEIFGGVPTAALSARGLIQMICERDGKEFVAVKP
jgi:phytoene dehydrogenase-like protein